jgi:hypothetical protein
MKRIILSAILAALVLTACSVPIPTLDLFVDFNPSAFGFEIDQQGQRIVAAHTVIFQARSGSIGGTIQGYRIEFFREDQSPMLEGDNVLYAQGAVGVYVKPGLTCDEFIADSNHRCTINDTNVRYTPGPIATKENFISLDLPIVDYLTFNNEVGDFAMVYFNVVTDNNFRQVIGPFEMSLVVPVGN